MPHLKNTDPEIQAIIDRELERERDGLELIPSENHTSKAVLEALATVFTDKYAEGYPGARYYAGNVFADELEETVRARAKNLFGVPHVNVQPYSGSPANLAVYFALTSPGDPIMGLDLLSGGHLTHGWRHSATSKFWQSFPYHLKSDGNFDFDEIAALAAEHKPKIIWCGGTAVPRAIPFSRFAEIADQVGAYLVADISHIVGLIIGGVHESPVKHAHLVTTTTHKTLRGPRGAMILVTDKGLEKNPKLAEQIDRAIIPGLQGGPHLNTIAAIGVALKEASEPAFKTYAASVVSNAKALAKNLLERGFKLVSGGTDNHLILIDFSETGIGRGKFFHLALERIGLYANMNTVPNDQSSPIYPSGLRLGTPAATTRGMGEKEMVMIADWILKISEHIKDWQLPAEKTERPNLMKSFETSLADDPFYQTLRVEVKELCESFPIPADPNSK
jgi:glycine hydroxymethyltransferase